MPNNASLIERLKALGYEVLPSKSQPGRLRWWKTTGGDGVSVPPKELSEVTFSTEHAAWFAVLSEVHDAEESFFEEVLDTPPFDQAEEQMDWVGRIRFVYPHIGSKEAFRLAERDYFEHDGILPGSEVPSPTVKAAHNPSLPRNMKS